MDVFKGFLASTVEAVAKIRDFSQASFLPHTCSVDFSLRSFQRTLVRCLPARRMQRIALANDRVWRRLKPTQTSAD